MEGLLQNTGPGHILVSHGVPSGVLCVCLCKRLCRHQKKQGNEVLRFPRRDSGLSRTSDSCQECPPVGTRLLSSPRIRKRTATVLVGLFFLRSASWNKAVKAGCSPEVIAHVGAEPRPKTEKEGCGRSRSWSARDQDDVSSAGAGPGRAVVPARAWARQASSSHRRASTGETHVRGLGRRAGAPGGPDGRRQDLPATRRGLCGLTSVRPACPGWPGLCHGGT